MRSPLECGDFHHLINGSLPVFPAGSTTWITQIGEWLDIASSRRIRSELGWAESELGFHLVPAFIQRGRRGR